MEPVSTSVMKRSELAAAKDDCMRFKRPAWRAQDSNKGIQAVTLFCAACSNIAQAASDLINSFNTPTSKEAAIVQSLSCSEKGCYMSKAVSFTLPRRAACSKKLSDSETLFTYPKTDQG